MVLFLFELLIFLLILANKSSDLVPGRIDNDCNNAYNYIQGV